MKTLKQLRIRINDMLQKEGIEEEMAAKVLAFYDCLSSLVAKKWVEFEKLTESIRNPDVLGLMQSDPESFMEISPTEWAWELDNLKEALGVLYPRLAA